MSDERASISGSGSQNHKQSDVDDNVTISVDQDRRFFAGGAIEAYCGPQELGAPDDLEAVIIDFINEAKLSLDIAIQELDSVAIAQAIIDAEWRGVRVRMFLEQDYLLPERESLKERLDAEYDSEGDKRDRQWQEHSDNRHGINREIFTALLRNGIDVKADFNPDIFHQKFIIRDYTTSDRQPPPAVLTGSTNFTVTGTHNNLNHIVIFHDKEIAFQYNREFNQLRRGAFGQGGVTRNSTKPKIHNLNGVPVRILFSPDDVPELEMVKQMLKAKRRIDFAIFTFSGSSAVDDAMVMINKANIYIRGVMETSQANQTWSSRDWLQQQGIDFYFPDKGDAAFNGQFGKMHHKLMVIDNDIIIGGSMNYTGPAADSNDENIFVIGSPYATDDKHRVNFSAQQALSRFFREEINRIIDHSVLQKK